MTQQLACSQIRTIKSDELDRELQNLNRDLQELKIQQKEFNRINNTKKSITNILIVRNQKVKENLREFYRDEKYKPKDLRMKKTRAIRRALTLKEESITLNKKKRNQYAYPKRKFAIKD